MAPAKVAGLPAHHSSNQRWRESQGIAAMRNNQAMLRIWNRAPDVPPPKKAAQPRAQKRHMGTPIVAWGTPAAQMAWECTVNKAVYQLTAVESDIESQLESDNLPRQMKRSVKHCMWPAAGHL